MSVNSERDAALRRAGRLLARRAHGRAELVAKLSRHVPADVAGSVTAELERSGLLDDERFAAELAAQRLAQGWGPRRIAFDLDVAGVAREIAEAAIAGLHDDAVRAGRCAATRGLDPVRAQRRLQARGFDVHDDV